MSNVLQFPTKQPIRTTAFRARLRSDRFRPASEPKGEAFVREVLQLAHGRACRTFAVVPAAITRQHEINRRITVLQRCGWIYRGGTESPEIYMSHPVHTGDYNTLLDLAWDYQCRKDREIAQSFTPGDAA